MCLPFFSIISHSLSSSSFSLYLVSCLISFISPFSTFKVLQAFPSDVESFSFRLVLCVVSSLRIIFYSLPYFYFLLSPSHIKRLESDSKKTIYYEKNFHLSTLHSVLSFVLPFHSLSTALYNFHFFLLFRFTVDVISKVF